MIDNAFASSSSAESNNYTSIHLRHSFNSNYTLHTVLENTLSIYVTIRYVAISPSKVATTAIINLMAGRNIGTAIVKLIKRISRQLGRVSRGRPAGFIKTA